MRHNVSKYSSKTLRVAKVKRDASNRRSNALGPAAIVSDMDDIANHTAHQQEIARQVESDGDCLWA